MNKYMETTRLIIMVAGFTSLGVGITSLGAGAISVVWSDMAMLKIATTCLFASATLWGLCVLITKIIDL